MYGYGYIYIIRNNITGETYIGQHKSSELWDSYMGSGVKLRKAQKKYGIENFEKYIICYVATEEEANEAEHYWIDVYKSQGKAEYNEAEGGHGNPFKYRESSENTQSSDTDTSGVLKEILSVLIEILKKE